MLENLLNKTSDHLHRNNVYLPRYNVKIDSWSSTFAYEYKTNSLIIPGWKNIFLRFRRGRQNVYQSLIHEFGHMFYTAYIRSRQELTFNTVFGDPHTDYPKYGYLTFLLNRYDPAYISKYAQIHPCEDFAETFKFHILANRRISKHRGNKQLQRKFTYVENLIHQNSK